MSATSPRRSRWSGRRRGEAGRARRASAEVVEALHAASRLEGPRLVERWLDRLDASGRYALLKLVTGGLRVGVTARLAKQALARFGGKEVTEIEEIWHGLKPPYVELFAWLEGSGERPVSAALAPFRPVMLAQALEEAEFAKLDPKDYAAEWKWDGIRVQAVAEKGVRKLYSRTGDDISGAFPDILEQLDFEGAIDGELLVAREDARLDRDRALRRPAAAAEPQDRLDRSSCRAHPAFIRAYDLLKDGDDDPRALPFAERRRAARSLRRDASPRRASTSRRSSPSPTGTRLPRFASIRRPTAASTRSPKG